MLGTGLELVLRTSGSLLWLLSRLDLGRLEVLDLDSGIYLAWEQLLQSA